MKMAEKPEDFNLPNAVVGRIVKDALPEGVSVSKEARVALSKAASIFVLYATSSANNFAQQSNRKTLTSQDVFAALEDLEFGEFIEPLKETLEAFRQEKARKLSSKKGKADKENTEVSLGESMETEVVTIDEEEEEEDEAEEIQEENSE